MRRVFAAAVVIVIAALLLHAQGTPPPSPLVLVTREGRRAVTTTVINNQEFIALDDVATLFQVQVREDTLASGVTITYKGRSIIASADQPMVSVAGRVVTLPTAMARVGRRLFVPIDFLPRALGPIYDTPIDLRRGPRLLLVGPLRVPRAVARIDAAGPPTRATLEIRPAATVTAISDAGRIVLRVEADALEVAPAPASAGLIDLIRAGDQPTSVTVMLNARAGTPRVTTAPIADGTRVSIEVPLAGAGQETTAAPPPPPLTPPPDLTAPPLLPPISARMETMVIDAGHGGEDAGVRGPGGTLEKQITLDVALRLKTLVETRLGVRVVMTRDDDRLVLPDARDAAANNSKADLFLSIHVNGSLSSAVSGAEVFYLRLDRDGENARRTTAATELVLPAVGGATRPIDLIRWDLAQALHVEASATFATALEEELRKQVPMSPRLLRQEPMRVLAGANMPAALVEIGYLTNPAQEKLLQSGDFQMKVAQSLFDAIVRFRTTLEGER